MTMTPEEAERRKSDRRQNQDPGFPGPERRVNDRRTASEQPKAE